MSHLAVVGAGYVGLTTAACLSHMGHQVACADIDEDKIRSLNHGEIPILEPRLEELVNEGLENGRLKFVVGGAIAAENAEFVFLCVPTPQSSDGSADLTYLRAATEELREVLQPGAVIVNKSTVPVGSAQIVEEALGIGGVSVVSNPEFMREGSAVSDFLAPDRIVIGSYDRPAAERVAGLFDSLKARIVITDPASAETIKYASNAFLAFRLSFINSIASVCEAVGADVHDVVRGIGYDDRIGEAFLSPGPGWGGSCLPKDTQALLRIARDGGYDFKLLRDVVAANEEQLDRVVDKVGVAVGQPLRGSTVAALGLTFKAATDDLRESPALSIINRLVRRGAAVKAYDPTVTQALAGMTVVDSPYAACEGADAVVILTEWPEFRELDFERVVRLMNRPSLVDARNLLDAESLRILGFRYQGIGIVG